MESFSPKEANELIPVLTPLVKQLWEKRRDLAIRLLEIDPALLAAKGVQRSEQPSRFFDLQAEIVQLVKQIEAHGCVMKDVGLGLLHFPSIRDGQPIYLCWKVGEPRLTHWHNANETFRDRKKIDS